VPATPIYAVFAPEKGGIYWNLFRQYSAAPDIFARYTQVTDETKPNGDESVTPQLIADSHIGYVRKVHDMGAVEAKIKSKASPDTNRWFRFNQSGDWGQGDVLTSHYIYITKMQSSANGVLDAAELPIRRPDIRNNHFDYMLTWFSISPASLTAHAWQSLKKWWAMMKLSRFIFSAPLMIVSLALVILPTSSAKSRKRRS